MISPRRHTTTPRPRSSSGRVVPALLVSLLAVVPLSACSDPAEPAAVPAGPTSAAVGQVTLSDAWVKVTDGSMTGVFGTLVNPTGADVTVTGAASQSVGKIEMHEVVGGKMRPKAGGFVIPAGGKHVLAPGGDHFMLMKLSGPVRAGDQIALTLTLSNGTSASVSAIGKATAAGEETYEASPSQ